MLRSPLGDLLRSRDRRVVRNLPTRPNTFFTGRDALMAGLARTFGAPLTEPRTPARWCVLSGMGGVGKSRLAIEFGWAHSASDGADYIATLFVDASDGDALDRGLAALAAPTVMDLPEHAAKEQQASLDAVLRWFNTHAGWLLVAENVDNEAAAAVLEARLAPLSGGRVLVTSRLGKERWGGSVAVQLVDELAPADAAAFLLVRTEGLRRVANDDAPRAADIARDLGCLPLGRVRRHPDPGSASAAAVFNVQ